MPFGFSSAEVSPMTTLLKVSGSLGVLAAIFVASWATMADPSSFPHRIYIRYTSLLERKLRPMFIFTPGRTIAIGQLLAAFLVIAAHILFTVDFWWAVLLIIGLAPSVWIENQRRKRVELIEEQLDNFVLAVANALKTTPSIGAALQSVIFVLQDPLKQELELAVKEMKVGSSLEQALLHMAARIGSRQLDSALSSILIGRQVGGNLPKVLETTASTLREMGRLEGVVKTKTAEGKLQLWVIGALPGLILVGMNYVWPGYFTPLQSSVTGYIISLLSITAWVSAIVLARKVLAVDM